MLNEFLGVVFQFAVYAIVFWLLYRIAMALTKIGNTLEEMLKLLRQNPPQRGPE